jgi:hypothetical protein
MGLPTQPVTLSPEAVAELNRKLSDTRHSVNNHLTLLTTALELIRRNPAAAERLVGSLVEQPAKVREEILRFSRAFEAMLGITRE